MKFWLSLILLIQSAWVLADALSDRLAGFAAQPESRGRFVETWSADYLSEPLVSRGKLSYKAPGQLSKIIEHPERVVQHIEANQLSVISNGESRSMQLSEHPELAAGIYALQDVLEGNENGLREHFEPHYSELGTDWTLKLVPRDKQVAQRIKSITLRGRDNRIHQVLVQYHNGDSLLTKISYDV